MPLVRYNLHHDYKQPDDLCFRKVGNPTRDVMEFEHANSINSWTPGSRGLGMGS